MNKKIPITNGHALEDSSLSEAVMKGEAMK